MTRDLEQAYRDNTGRPPPVDDTDDRWQWEYRGTRNERELLEQLLGLDQADDQPAQTETLFDPRSLEPRRCPLKACDTTRKNLCRHDADHQDTPPQERPPRPRGCLNAYDPATAPLPDTY